MTIELTPAMKRDFHALCIQKGVMMTDVLKNFIQREIDKAKQAK